MAKTFKKVMFTGLAVCVATVCGVCAVACGGTPDDDTPPEPTMYTVTFDVQGHGVAPEAQQVEEGGYAQKPATNPSADNWIFDNWYKEAAGTTVFDFATAITANTTIYAVWTEAPKVPTVTMGETPTYHIYNSGYAGETTGDAYDAENNIWHYVNTFVDPQIEIDYVYNEVQITDVIQLMWHIDDCEAGKTYKLDIRATGDKTDFDQVASIRQNFEAWSSVGQNAEFIYKGWNKTFGLIGLQVEFTADEINSRLCKVVLQNTAYQDGDDPITLRIICAPGDAH